MFQDAASSLPLQISLYFHGYYSIALVVLSLLIFIYKSALLPYPPSILGFEVTYVFLYGIVEWVRIRQGPFVGVWGAPCGYCCRPCALAYAACFPPSTSGSPAALFFLPPPTHTPPSLHFAPCAASKGNKLESISNVLFSILLAAPVLVFHIYFIGFQTYVLRLDIIIQALALAATSLECVLSVLAVLAFSKTQTL
jgi:hypothetical protein